MKAADRPSEKRSAADNPPREVPVTTIATPTAVVFLWALVALAPFWTIYLAHGLAPNEGPTGYISYDPPYYSANGRETFERGNGFSFPNPYSTSSEPPAIYFYWFLWLLGFGVVHGGIDPGLLFVAIGAVSGVAMAMLTWRLVGRVLPQSALQPLLFLLVTWGGGLLCFGKLGVNALTGAPLGRELLLFDPHVGMWFLNWGRNVVIATEATYHVLAAACWLFALTRQYWWSLLFAGLLAGTHPWSGLEILATVCGFHLLRVFGTPRTKAMPHFIVSGLMLALLLGYNLLFLDQFVEHRALHQDWAINWNLPTASVVLAWAPVAVLALARCVRDWRRFGWDEVFLAVAFGVAFVLSVHDRFMAPTQPLHFTRGYVWMPLMLLGLPWLQRRLVALRGRWPAGRFWASCVFGLFVAGFDNVVFIHDRATRQLTGEDGFSLAQSERELFHRVDELGLEGVALFRDARLSYLSATYTRLTPYFGHLYNTLDYDERFKHSEQLFAGATPSSVKWESSIDYLIARRDEIEMLAPDVRAGLSLVVAVGDIALYRFGRPL